MTELSEVDGNILEGVSATTLWTLHNRGTEAKRSDGVIRDPWAVTLFDSISYDYRKFGKPNQSHALRARAFDSAAQDYLTAYPKASVVALAEGLQSSFWRLERAGVADELTWYSVDLPPVVALRERLLPHDDRIVALAQSALDLSWMDRVDDSHGVFITAEGLRLEILQTGEIRAHRVLDAVELTTFPSQPTRNACFGELDALRFPTDTSPMPPNPPTARPGRFGERRGRFASS